MGNTSTVIFGFEQAPLTPEDSRNGKIKVIDVARKKSYGGRLWNHEGEQEAW